VFPIARSSTSGIFSRKAFSKVKSVFERNNIEREIRKRKIEGELLF